MYIFVLHSLSDIMDCINGTNEICEQTCIELEGGFSCGCNDGYRLNSDNVSCEGKALSCQLNKYICNVLV